MYLTPVKWDDGLLQLFKNWVCKAIKFSSLGQSCLSLCDPVDWITPGFPVHHQHLEPVQTHGHRVSDAIQPSHLLCPLLLSPSVLPSIRAFSNESASGGQSIGVSASTSVLPMNTQEWFPVGWTGLIYLQFKGLLRVFSNTTVQKHQYYSSALFMVQLSHPYMTTGKIITLTIWTFVGKVMSLIFNMLSRLVIAFLPRSMHLLMSWLQSPSAVIFGAQEY